MRVRPTDSDSPATTTDSMQQTFQRDRSTWLAYLLLAFYGYHLNLLGPITPFLKNELRLSYTVSSLHFTAFALGILLVGLGGHRVIQWIGRGTSLWLGAFGLGLGTLLLAIGKSPCVTIGATFVMGLIGSLTLVIVPSLLSDRHGTFRSVALSEANVIASLAAAMAPLLIGWSARFLGNWRMALGLGAIVPVFLRLGFGRMELPGTPTPDRNELQPGGTLPPRFWVYWISIVLAVSTEFCMISWSSDYLEKGLGVSRASAAQSLSLFLAAMILGRLLGSRLARTCSIQRLVTVSILIAGTGFHLFWLSGDAWAALLGLAIAGLGIASLYPLLLALAMEAAAGNTVMASARATLASGFAILVLPLLLGRLADAIGIRQAYGVVALLLLCLLLVTQYALRRGAGRSPQAF
jgi:fucose permease